MGHLFNASVRASPSLTLDLLLGVSPALRRCSTAVSLVADDVNQLLPEKWGAVSRDSMVGMQVSIRKAMARGKLC